MTDVYAAINEFGKLVGSKNEASPNVFYRWQELRDQLEQALATADREAEALRGNHAAEVANLRREVELGHSAWKKRDEDCKAADERARRLQEQLDAARQALEAILSTGAGEWNLLEVHRIARAALLTEGLPARAALGVGDD